MSLNSEPNNRPDVTKVQTRIFVDELDLKKDLQLKSLKDNLTIVFNKGRERMSKLDPISVMVVRGGNPETREMNINLLKTACEATMFRLSNDDPRSEVSIWMNENKKSSSPFLFRETPPLDFTEEGKKPYTRPAVAICLNGLNTNNFEVEKLKDDFVRELGLVLTEMNQLTLYPRKWEGRQAFTNKTYHKSI